MTEPPSEPRVESGQQVESGFEPRAESGRVQYGSGPQAESGSESRAESRSALQAESRSEPRALAQRLLAGDRRALARGISLVEDNRAEGWQLVREVYPHTGRAAVVGFTGPPGVGKSTLIGALTRVRRAAGRTVGVLSIDPSSPFTEGALLGDRIRLSEHFLDPGVFIRSMANRGALGGLSEAALQAALLLDAAGRQDVFVETVGVGQAEVDIIDHADTVVLVLMPGSGDSIQALKAGVMEIPDVIAINKADHPLTDTMVREIRGVLSLANLDRDGDAAQPWRVPIVRTEAAIGRGVEELIERLEEHRAHILAAGQLAERRRRNLRGEVLALASARMRRRLEARLRGDTELERLLDEVVERRLDPASAAAALLERVGVGEDDREPADAP
ncbi:MAG TPA: methylmalonyl Co-A mutase-associated GTPase MeaB [Solirubrobacteraceae bacterium]|nr:methylmalonyl Co-A mutase-associated GTPase MeaB [Solirubrobacteraceae bacterium]